MKRWERGELMAVKCHVLFADYCGVCVCVCLCSHVLCACMLVGLKYLSDSFAMYILFWGDGEGLYVSNLKKKKRKGREGGKEEDREGRDMNSSLSLTWQLLFCSLANLCDDLSIVHMPVSEKKKWTHRTWAIEAKGRENIIDSRSPMNWLNQSQKSALL